MYLTSRLFWREKLILAAIFLATFAFLALYGISHRLVLAEEGELESITLEPSNKKYQVDAGQTINDELTILNDGTTAYDFIVYARPYSVTGEEYTPDYTSVQPNADAYRWVQFSQTNWHIEPRQTVKVPYTIHVPEDAAPGGHYGVIFAESQPGTASGFAVTFKKRVGSVIYATVNGPYISGGQLLDTFVDPIQFHAPLTAAFNIENSGNADFDVETLYTVSDIFGNVKHKQHKTSIILPKTIRNVPLEWNDSPWLGLYKVRIDNAYLDKTASSDKYVLVAPRWMLATVGLMIVGGGVYAMLQRRRN